MRWSTYRRLLSLAQLAGLAGLGLGIGWNLAAGYFNLGAGWIGLMLPLPGFLLWSGLLSVPPLLSRSLPTYPHSYRLRYDAPPGWDDRRARQALRAVMRSGVGIEIIWAKTGDELGCWLRTDAAGDLLPRLIADVFPGGQLTPSPPPAEQDAVPIYGWPEGINAPIQLDEQSIDGLRYRWLSPTNASICVWGPAAKAAIEALGGVIGESSGFSGDNPWPDLPPFPASADRPGLAALCQVRLVAPLLRTKNAPALVIGRDAETQPVGLELADLDGRSRIEIAGQTGETVVTHLLEQAIQAGRAVLLLDGSGGVVNQLSRRLLREVAGGQVLTCDVERPAQSRFQLNPLWLPGDALAKQGVLTNGWPRWLRDLGVTMAGLGLTAYRQTVVTIFLAALREALDPPTLRDRLTQPDFLAANTTPEQLTGLVDDNIMEWWVSEQSRVERFDLHFRLAHLRNHLSDLLALPEYSVLWRPPFLDPLAALSSGQSLLLRLTDPKGRLAPYRRSQLLAVTSLLSAWPPDGPPPLVCLYALPLGRWVEIFSQQTCAPLLYTSLPGENGFKPTTRLISRLPEGVSLTLPGIAPGDLQRLPPDRLVMQRGQAVATVDLEM